MDKPGQISFRPDPGVKYAYDALLAELRKKDPTNRGINKELISSLIRKEYERQFNSTTCFEIDEAVDWDSYNFNIGVQAHFVEPTAEMSKQVLVNGWGDWESMMNEWHYQVDYYDEETDQVEDLNDIVASHGFDYSTAYEYFVGDLRVDDLADAVNSGALTKEILKGLRNPLQVRHFYPAQPHGQLGQLWVYGKFALLRLIDQQFFLDPGKVDSMLDLQKRMNQYSDWHLVPTSPEVDLSDGTLVKEHMTADGDLYELILKDGDLWGRTTPCDDSGEPCGDPVVELITGGSNTEESKKRSTSETLLDFRSEDVAITNFLQGLDTPTADTATQTDKKKSEREQIIDRWEALVRDVSKGWWRRGLDYDDLRERALKLKDIDDVPNLYVPLLPPHIGCWEPNGVGDGELENDATVENIDYVLGSFNSHAQALERCAKDHVPKEVLGRKIFEYYDMVGLDRDPETGRSVPTGVYGQFDHDSLLKFCQDKRNRVKYCFVAIMAAMAVRKDNFLSAWATIDLIVPVLQEFRNRPEMTRSEAYEALRVLKVTGGLKGLRPATWCSLIYFLRPKQDGYMMSTMTAKSVNTLVSHNNPIVYTSKQGYPEDENTANSYELYCRIIDGVGRKLNISGGKAEEILQSSDGLPWREYLNKIK